MCKYRIYFKGLKNIFYSLLKYEKEGSFMAFLTMYQNEVQHYFSYIQQEVEYIEKAIQRKRGQVLSHSHHLT